MYVFNMVLTKLPEVFLKNNKLFYFFNILKCRGLRITGAPPQKKNQVEGLT